MNKRLEENTKLSALFRIYESNSEDSKQASCGELTLAGHQVPTKATLSLPLVSWTGERKYTERLEGRGKDKERSFTSYRHRQNQT